KLEPKIDPLLDCFATLAKVRQGSESLFEARHGFRIGRAVGGLGPGLTEICDGLVPNFAAEGMVGQAVDVLSQPVSMQVLNRRQDPSVEGPPSIREDACVGHLVAQSVLEDVFPLWDELRLMEELAPMKLREAGTEGLFW